jgi:pimeloyl-ACP methyl ester carboxylesterase
MATMYHKHLDRRFTKHFDNSKYYIINDSKVFCQYTISDPNKPYLLLLHGFGVDGRITLFPHYRSFSKDFNVIIPDMPHFGKSINYSNNYSVYYAANTLKLLLDSLKVPSHRLYVCGLSYGGLIAALLNKELNGNLGGIVLTNTPIKYFDIQHFVYGKSKYQVNTGLDLILPESPKALTELFRAGSKFPLFIPKFVKQQILNDIFLPDRERKASVLKTIASESNRLFEDDYGFKYQKNIALIVGSNDDLVPPPIADSIKMNLASHAEIKILKGESHNLISEAKFKWYKYVHALLLRWEVQQKNIVPVSAQK